MIAAVIVLAALIALAAGDLYAERGRHRAHRRVAGVLISGLTLAAVAALVLSIPHPAEARTQHHTIVRSQSR